MGGSTFGYHPSATAHVVIVPPSTASSGITVKGITSHFSHLMEHDDHPSHVRRPGAGTAGTTLSVTVELSLSYSPEVSRSERYYRDPGSNWRR